MVGWFGLGWYGMNTSSAGFPLSPRAEPARIHPVDVVAVILINNTFHPNKRYDMIRYKKKDLLLICRYFYERNWIFYSILE